MSGSVYQSVILVGCEHVEQMQLMNQTSSDAVDAGSLIHFDVVVVGGGPAGTAAAFTAKSLGLKVCLIDKATFPREKLCGGLVTPRSRRIHSVIFGADIDNELLVESDAIWFHSKLKILEKIVGYKKLYFCMRFNFDHSLIERCRDKGVDMKLGCSVSSIDFDLKIIETNSEFSCTYGVLIAADGANSQVAKMIFGEAFDKQKIGFGLEVEVPRAALPHQGEHVEIDFAAAKWGYGWVFPKKESFTVGVGGIHRLNPDMKDRFSTYMASKGLDISQYKVKGQYVPFGDFKKIPGDKNVLLVGDAAGVVDPITGEGIAYAFETGHFAALAAQEAILHGKPASALEYFTADFRRITNTIKQANLWRLLIFPRPIQGLFAWAFSDASTLQKGYLDVLAGDADYGILTKVFFLQAGKAISKPFRILKSKLQR
jgi:menaquinone-9 beta-reductase